MKQDFDNTRDQEKDELTDAAKCELEKRESTWHRWIKGELDTEEFNALTHTFSQERLWRLAEHAPNLYREFAQECDLHDLINGGITLLTGGFVPQKKPLIRSETPEQRAESLLQCMRECWLDELEDYEPVINEYVKKLRRGMNSPPPEISP